MQNDIKYIVFAFPFWMIFIISFFTRFYLYSDISKPPFFILIIEWMGIVIFGWCLYRLYIRKNYLTKLITTGMFKYTRHPMYTAVLMMDLDKWFIKDYDFYFWLSAIVLYVSIFITAYFQEKETIARFGDEAIAYYKKTPRLILLYPVDIIAFRLLKFGSQKT